MKKKRREIESVRARKRENKKKKINSSINPGGPMVNTAGVSLCVAASPTVTPRRQLMLRNRLNLRTMAWFGGGNQGTAKPRHMGPTHIKINCYEAEGIST